MTLPPHGAPDHATQLADVAALAVGGLPAEQLRAVLAHLDGCATCRSEKALMEETVARLEEVPPEAYLDGPPEGADLLIRRTVRAIRAQEGARPEDPAIEAPEPDSAGTDGHRVDHSLTGRRRHRRSAAPRLVAAAAVILAVGAAGVVAGRLSAPGASGVAASGVTVSPSPDAAGTRVASATDAVTGARLTVKVVPAAGWVRVSVNASGIRQGQRCVLVVMDRAGGRTVAGSWLVSATGEERGTALSGSALVDPSQVGAVRVENTAGDVLVTASV